MQVQIQISRETLYLITDYSLQITLILHFAQVLKINILLTYSCNIKSNLIFYNKSNLLWQH